MFGHCLFCCNSLGANDTIEHCRVGERLAFEAARGRLWVVCPSCQRWNLTPIEERWEAIDECEWRFRRTPVRACTDNIGLTRLRCGLELVRIGKALRPEIAVWRYGKHLRRRYFVNAGRKMVAGMGVGVLAGATLAGVVTPAVAMGAVALAYPVLVVWRGAGVIGRVRDSRSVMPVRRRDLPSTRLVATEDGYGWELLLKHAGGTTLFSGADAASALGRILVHVNSAGASEYSVGVALDRLALMDETHGFIASTAHRAEWHTAQLFEAERRRDWWGSRRLDDYEPPTLGDLDYHLRLALEMALHDEIERKALEGELAALEAAWREAEEVAAIADALLVPEYVERRLREAKLRSVVG
jgi:hypothetical protein